MSSKKNLYSVQKIKNFLKQYPVLLIYQHNNLTVKQRIDLKKQLHSFPTVKTLTVKNSIINRVMIGYFFNLELVHPIARLKNTNQITTNNVFFHRENIKNTNYSSNLNNSGQLSSSESLEKTKALYFNNLLQGPVFLLGCNSHEDIKNIWNIFKSSPNFLFLGGQSKNQIYTHLDIQKSIELNNTVYYELVNNIDHYVYYQISSSLLFPFYQNSCILSCSREFKI